MAAWLALGSRHCKARSTRLHGASKMQDAISPTGIYYKIVKQARLNFFFQFTFGFS